jgi:hypothetical protein
MVMQDGARFPAEPTNQRPARSNSGEQFLASFKIAGKLRDFYRGASPMSRFGTKREY